jgi:sugar (pentulose or hexulose) kinase
MSTVVTVGGRHRAVLAGSSSAGAVLEPLLENGFDDLPAGPTGVLVLPYLRGRQTPAPDPAAGFRIVGDGPSPAVLAKATLEGLSLHTRWMLEEQGRLAGPAETVFLFGGAVAANPAWTRIKAEILPTALRVVPEAEPVATGAALVAAVRAGHADPPGPALATEAAPAGPSPEYDDMYTRFVAAAQETS